MQPRRPLRARRILRHVAATLSSLLLVFAIVTGLFQANTRYFYCESMGFLREDPCKAAAAMNHEATQQEESAPADELSRTPFSCCSTGVLGAIPQATAPGTVRSPAAPMVAIVALPSPLEAWERATNDASRATRGHRAPIPPRPARERRAQSMIFLT